MWLGKLAKDGYLTRHSIDDEESHFCTPLGRASSCLQRRLPLVKDILLAALGFLGLSALLLTLYLSSQAKTDNKDTSGLWRQSCYCGKSIAEAKTMGCKYDALSSAWLPPHCRDDDLTAEFLAHEDGPWEYWADQAHTKLLTLEEVSSLGTYFFSAGN